MTGSDDTRRTLVARSMTVGGYVREGSGDRLRPSTLKAYARLYGAFRAWCRSVGYRSMPATPETLAEYAVHLRTQRGYARGTALEAVVAVKYFHAVRGEPVPSGVPAWYVLRVLDSTPDDRQRKARPLRRAVLDALLDQCDPDEPAGVRDRALVLLNWSALLDTPALVALDMASVRVGAGWMVLDVGPRTVEVPHNHDDGTDAICTACAVYNWRALLVARGARTGPLFRRVDKGRNIGGIDRTTGRPTAGGRMNPRSVGKVYARLRTAAGLPTAEEVTNRAVRLAGLGEHRRRGAGRAELAELAGYLTNSARLLELIAAVDDGEWIK